MSPDDFMSDPPISWPFPEDVNAIRAKFPKHTKVLISIGGWGDTKAFSEAAKSQSSRERFAKNVATMVYGTGIDGIDLDWEYPGGNGEDYKNIPNSEKEWEIEAFPKLLAQLRSELGSNKTLTAAVPGLPRDMIAFTNDTVPSINSSLDFINVMTYDLMNRRDTITKHHAGTEASTQSIDTYIELGFPSKKLNVGFAFYVKWFETELEDCISNPVGCKVPLMEDPETGDDLGQCGAFDWRSIPPDLKRPFQKALDNGSYDRIGGGHYYWDLEDRRWWTWETPEAIRKKFESLVPTRGLGGVFAWALGEDAPDFSHLKALGKSIAEYHKDRG